MEEQKITIIISVFGTIITLASLFVSYAQYKAADLQAKAATMTLLPQIEVLKSYIQDENNFYTDVFLKINSDGGPVYNFNSDRLTWITVNKNGKFLIDQPLIGYFSASSSSGKTKGEIQTIVGYKNNKKFGDLQQNIESPFSIESPRTLIKTTFIDSFNKNNEEYFLVEHTGVKKIHADTGKNQWEEYKKNQENTGFIDIDTVDKKLWLKNLDKMKTR